MLNKKKYIISLLCMLFITIFGISYINATEVTNENIVTEEKETVNITGMFDTKLVNGVYKTSENDKNLNLPFIRYVADRMIIDKEIIKSGFSFAAKAIEVNAPTKGIQVMFSSDTIRVNSSMEYGILMSDSNIIVESEIKNSLILISSGTITISENAKISEDIICICENLEIQGEVSQNVIGLATSTNISGIIGNDLRLMTNDIKISSDQNVKNNIYIETYNQELNLSEQYKEAVVKLKEIEEVSEFTLSNIFSILSSCLIFTLIYIIVNKIAKKNIFLEMTNKVKENSTWVIVSGIILFLVSIPAVLLLIMLSVMGLWIVAVPILLLYIVFLVITCIINIFIVGSLMYSYIKEKYLKSSGIGTDILGAFCAFLVLSILTKIPVIGAYIIIILNILAAGILFSLLFKRKKVSN